MIKSLYEQILKNQDVRANLIALKKEIKDVQNKSTLAYLLEGDFSVFIQLLRHEDAKVRKNTALILGEMECDDVVSELWDAYEREEQLFVKSAYLKGIENYGYKEYLPRLKHQLEQLHQKNAEENEKKHIREESTALKKLILKYEKPEKHIFKESGQEMEVILLTNREHREITRNQIEEQTVLLASGVRVKTKEVKKLMEIRTFSEMLFTIPKTGVLSDDPEKAAEELAGSGLLVLLNCLHCGEGAFYFRTDVRGRMPLDKRSSFLKRFSAALENNSDRALVNSASEYEIELRLLEKKDGGYIPLLKLFTLKDKRFAYRKNVLASSIAPSNAALIMKLAEEWLTEDAQVLDPFCGVGTMLIERNKLKKANPLYGIDIYEEAILKARENTEKANMIINYVNRNFFDFKHEYLFDEIITNMPVVSRTKGVEEITKLYESFFEKLTAILKKDGKILLYTREESILIHCLKKYPFVSQIKKWTINEREGSQAFLFSLN